MINTPPDGFRSAASVETLISMFDKNKLITDNPVTIDKVFSHPYSIDKDGIIKKGK